MHSTSSKLNLPIARSRGWAFTSRGRADKFSNGERTLQAARAYNEQTVAEATGHSARFLQIYEEYKKAPEVTRKRMYLDTMERVLGGTDKIILITHHRAGCVIPRRP
jgi:modulator of FtsH protease HflK